MTLLKDRQMCILDDKSNVHSCLFICSNYLCAHCVKHAKRLCVQLVLNKINKRKIKFIGGRHSDIECRTKIN